MGLLKDSTLSHAVWKEGSVKAGSGTLIQKGIGEKRGNSTETDVKEHSLDDMKKAATYAGWKDGSDKALVATEGGKGTPWRIYDGKTMPLLTSLMKGTKRLAKVYDGNVFATTDPHITLVNTGKDVGTYDAYSDQLGYDLIGGATITQRVLTMSGVAAQTKVYDGTTYADAAQFHATLNNVVAGEESLVTATATGAAYNSKDVASANAVSYTLALRGTGAGNYRIAPVQGAGSITAKQLNLALTGGARFDKTYDGNANVTQSLTKGTNYTLTNFADGEGAGITITGAGTYTDKNAGTGKTVTFGGLTLTGSGAGNYRLSTDTLTGTGTITHRDLTLTADAQSIVQGEALPSFTGRAEGFADGEDERVFGTDGITFGTTLTNTDTPGSYGVTGRIGSTSDGVLGNYRIGQAAGNANVFTIHAANLPGGLLASLVQDAAPRFDMGFGQEVYVFGLPRPIPTATLGIYRFAAARAISIEGVRLD